MTDQRLREIADGLIEALQYAANSHGEAIVKGAILAAWREGMQEAAGICESERVENDGNAGDTGYNMAIKHCAAAIRAKVE